MHRHWKIHRHLIEAPDALHRWDRAYQLLLRWGAAAAPPSERAVLDAGVHHQEVANELCYLRPGLDTTASPDADD